MGRDPLRIDARGTAHRVVEHLLLVGLRDRPRNDSPDRRRELSLGSLAIAIAHRPERFLDKERWHGLTTDPRRVLRAAARPIGIEMGRVVAPGAAFVRLRSTVDHRRDVQLVMRSTRSDCTTTPTSCSRGAVLRHETAATDRHNFDDDRFDSGDYSRKQPT